MVDFTNSSQDRMNLDSVIRLYARMDSIYRRIINGLVDPEDAETTAFVEEYMPSLIDYILEIAQADISDPTIDRMAEGLEVDMDELYDTCEFFDFDPHQIFILEDQA